MGLSRTFTTQLYILVCLSLFNVLIKKNLDFSEKYPYKSYSSFSGLEPDTNEVKNTVSITFGE